MASRKRDHVVPLAAAALAILEQLPREDGDYLFPGGSAGEPLSNAALAAVIDRMNESRAAAGLPKWVDPQQDGRQATVHGFRSCFRDWVAEETDYPGDMAEMALAHTLPDKVEAAYRRGAMREKRRRMMADWAAYCARPPVARTAAEVITMPETRVVRSWASRHRNRMTCWPPSNE